MVHRSCESAFDREMPPPPPQKNSALKCGPAKTGPAGPRAMPMIIMSSGPVKAGPAGPAASGGREGSL